MSTPAEIAAQLGIDPQMVEDVLAASSESERGPKIGYGRCMNPECDRFETLDEVPFERHTKTVMAEDMPIAVTRTHYDVFESGAEHCPGCGEARALLPEKPRKIPVYVR